MQLRGSIENRSPIMSPSPAPTSMSASTSISASGRTGIVPATAWNVAKSIYYEEGVLAFWRGEE